MTIIAEMRNFVLHDEDGTEHGVYEGKQPRQAALKAANRSEGTKKKPVTIRLRACLNILLSFSSCFYSTQSSNHYMDHRSIYECLT